MQQTSYTSARFMLQGVFYGELFAELGLVLGTSLNPVTTYFIEPAFVNSTVSCICPSCSSCQRVQHPLQLI